MKCNIDLEVMLDTYACICFIDYIREGVLDLSKVNKEKADEMSKNKNTFLKKKIKNDR